MRRVLLCMCLMAVLATTAWAYQVGPRKQRVYMFGYATSYVDSTSYITDLQAIDGYIKPNGFLADRALYSLQFNNFLVAKLGRENMTCMVFFSKKKSKAEKKFLKVRKKSREKRSIIPQNIGMDLFRFEPEEWVDSQMYETLPNK